MAALEGHHLNYRRKDDFVVRKQISIRERMLGS